jgi:hypothetical protein
MDNTKGVFKNETGSVMHQSTYLNLVTALKPSEHDGIVQVDITDAFLFEVFPDAMDGTSIIDEVSEGDDDDVSELSQPESCMLNSGFEWLLGSEPSSLRPSLNIMAAAMEMPATMEILCSNDVWVCDTTASYHFVKSEMGHTIAARLIECLRV